MAVTRGENVILMGADNDTVLGPLRIVAIKVKSGATGGTSQLKQADTTGMVLWENTLAVTSEQFDTVKLTIGNGETLHLDTVATTSVWLYLE